MDFYKFIKNRVRQVDQCKIGSGSAGLSHPDFISQRWRKIREYPDFSRLRDKIWVRKKGFGSRLPDDDNNKDNYKSIHPVPECAVCVYCIA